MPEMEKYNRCYPLFYDKDLICLIPDSGRSAGLHIFQEKSLFSVFPS